MEDHELTPQQRVVVVELLEMFDVHVAPSAVPFVHLSRSHPSVAQPTVAPAFRVEFGSQSASLTEEHYTRLRSLLAVASIPLDASRHDRERQGSPTG